MNNFEREALIAMSKTGYYNQGRVLREGEYYDFKYVKDVTLEDQNPYMVLEDQHGYRYFVESKCYEQYKLTPSNLIKCYVDKINCTGRIFLEPEHPVYKRGEAYEFDVHSIIDTEEGTIVSVSDCFGNLINLKACIELNEEELPPTKITGLVDKVKKGIPEIVIKC